MSFKAPWCKALWISSALATVIIGLVGWFAGRDAPGAIGWLVRGLPFLLLGGALPFVVRGYTITPHEVRVHRLLWHDRLPREGLISATADPRAMSGSLRLFGNGGLFAITGLYRNAALGRFRAFVNDPKLSVILRYANRTVVLAPEDPERFAALLNAPVVRGASWNPGGLG